MYYFGQRLNYESPKADARNTLCVFIRDDNGKAVIMFEHAEWAARVNYRFLSPHREGRG